MTSVLRRGMEETYSEEGEAMTEEQTGVMGRQAKGHHDCQQPPEKQGERPGADSPSELPEGTNPDDTLILNFWSPAL